MVLQVLDLKLVHATLFDISIVVFKTHTLHFEIPHVVDEALILAPIEKDFSIRVV